MVSVDDLIISLRIDPTSNLGKLQKQLTALVGEKGEKATALGFGVSPDIKNTLLEIKRRMIVLTPTVLADKEQVQIAALGIATDLKRNKELRGLILSRYSTSADKLDEFIEELFIIATDLSDLNNDQQKRFVSEMDKLRKIGTMSKGDRDTLMSKLTKMLLESRILQGKMIDIFSKGGIKAVSQYYVHELNKSSVGESFTDAIKKFEANDPVGRFAKLKKIFLDNSDGLEAMNKAYKEVKKKLFDITEITQEAIENDDELKEIIVAQVAASLKKSTWMLSDFYKAAKTSYTGGKGFGVKGAKRLDMVVNSFSNQALKDLGLEKIYGELDENRKNILTELKLEGNKTEIENELFKRLIKQDFDQIVIIAERFTNEGIQFAKDFFTKEEHKGKSAVFYKITPRLTEKILGIEKNLDELERNANTIARDRDEEKKNDEEIMTKLTDEEKQIAKFLEASEDFIKPEKITGEMKKPGYETKDRLKAIFEKLEEMEELELDTNKEVKKKPNEPEVEKDPFD